MKHLSLLFVLWPILSGCATRVPGSGATWHDEPRHESDLPPNPRANWERGLSLQDLFDAVETSPEIQAQLHHLELARKRQRAAAELNPVGGFEGGGAKASNVDRSALGGEIRHVFDGGNQTRLRLEVADLGVQSKAADAREVLRQARLGAARAYWRAVAAQERVDARTLVSGRLASTIRDPRGSTDRFDDDRRSTRAELERIAGGHASPGWRLTDRFPADRPRADVARARDLARSSRPSMASAASSLSSARARILLAESSATTDVSFGVSYQVERDAMVATYQARIQERRTFAGASFTIPGHPPHRIEEAERERRLSADELRDAEASVVQEAEEACRRYNEKLARLVEVERGRREGSPANIDALEEWMEARCELEAAVERPIDEFSR